MRVLLTGATGYIGGHLLAACRRQGLEVVALGRRQPVGWDTTVPFLEADLLAGPDVGDLVRRAGASHLLHAAWCTEYGRYWTSPLNARWVDASCRLVEAFCEAGGRQVVGVGTCAEYDWAQGYCTEGLTPCEPATLYGTAKDAARRLVLAQCRQHGIVGAWGRLFYPYGPGEPAQRLLPALGRVLRGEQPVFEVGTTAFRDFLFAEDMADAFVALLRTDQGGEYNVCSGEPVRVGVLIERLAALLGADPAPLLTAHRERAGEPPLLAGDSRRLRALGWAPRFTLEQGLARTFVPMPSH